MFLFLSKLLPLFIYPLGLSCLLLILALYLSWRQSRWVPVPVSLALVILLLASNGWVNNFLIRSLEWQNIPTEIPTADAIVVLGGATKPPLPPRPMADVNEQGDRLLYAVKLYQEKKAPLIIAAGGRIKWMGGGQSESADMAELLELMGVPESAIIQEPDSLNTYQNAVNVKKILVARGIKKVLLVTSAFHMPRSLLIFQHLEIEAIAAPTDFLETEGENPSFFVFDILPDPERLTTTTKALKEYLGLVIYRLRGWL